MQQAKLKPRTRTPDLEVSTIDGGVWKISEQSPENFTMVVAYRGRHCPVCKTYLQDLNRHTGAFADRGVNILAVSMDTEERARQAQTDWALDKLKIGYGMNVATARAWGLYVSTGRGKTSMGVEEPSEFSEPGVFLVKPDQTLYAALVNTMPFARPHFEEVLAAIDFIVKNDYPARGEA